MDDFDDDGFDDLNIALLQELESKAILSLQSQRPFQQPYQHRLQQSLHGNAPNVGDGTVEVIQIEDDVDQTDAEVLRELARVPAQHSMTGRLVVAAAPPPLPLPAYSQPNLVDVPLPAAERKNDSHNGVMINTNPPPSNAYYRGTQWQGPGTRGFPQANAMAAPPRPSGPQSMGAVTNAHTNPHQDSTSIAALQARLRTLETDLYTAKGRASMMHDKYETAQRKHEAELARIQKQKDEEVEKQRQRAEAATAAYRSTATELEFIKQDLKDEVEKGKKGRRTDRTDAPSTPRKNTAGRSNWDVADGFEDADLLLSPSKGFGRRMKDAGSGAFTPAVERTPTKTKRRRPITDSPSIPLETVAVETDQEPRHGSPGPGMPATTDSAGAGGTSASTEEAPFLFLQEVLNHQAHPNEPATVELFSRYSFPSNPQQTLAFLLLQRIPKLEGRQGTTRLMLDFCQLVLGIWSQCLREKYYAPVRALVSLVSYILTHDPRGVAPHILESLLPLAQTTIYLVAEPAFYNPSDSLATHPDYAVRQLACEIDTGAIISLLRLVALGCLDQSRADKPTSGQQSSQVSDRGLSTESQAWFWGLVHFEFVLLMLSSKQPPEAFLGMLSLLQTSALSDSIGPITKDPNRDASVVASLIIDRISHHIEEPPKWAGSSKRTEWDVRLSALGVLDCFAQSPFGKLSLAASHCALPRLVDVLFPAYEELRSRDLLHEPLHPSMGQPPFTETQMRAYGLGGLNLTSSAGFGPSKTTPDAASAEDLNSGRAAADQDPIPLVLLYVSSAIRLLYSIVTDPFTAAVADMPAKLAEKRGGTQSFYLLTMARLGFRADPAFAVGLGEETYDSALELFTLAATSDEAKDYAAWAQQSGTGDSYSTEATGWTENQQATFSSVTPQQASARGNGSSGELVQSSVLEIFEQRVPTQATDLPRRQLLGHCCLSWFKQS